MSPPDVLLNTGTYAALLEQLSPGSTSSNRRSEEAGLFSPRHENQTALARLAQVCRATSGPALALLWRSIDKFEYLLSLFKSYDVHEHMFTDAVTDADWMRFRDYACCVRELHLSDLMDVHASIWTTLTLRCVREPLLPRLDRLTNFVVGPMSSCYNMLLSPTIRHLGLAFDSSATDKTLRVGIELVKPILPQLISLSVTRYHDGRSCLEMTQAQISLSDLSHLQEFWVDNWAPLERDIEALGKFPHLRVLHINILYSMFRNQELRSTEAFRSLRELEVVGSALYEVALFLQVAPLPVLEKASFIVEIIGRDGFDPGEEWKDVLTHLPLSTLRAFRAEYKPVSSYDGRMDPAALLDLLVPFSGLESLVLVFNQVASHLYDNHLQSLRDSWPDLAVFEVVVLERPFLRHGYGPPGRQPPGNRFMHGVLPASTPYYWGNAPPSIATLATFAAAHSHLRQLAVPALDLSGVPDVASVPHLRHGLRVLRISALINDAPLLPFVLALDLLFPNLDLRAVNSELVAPTGPVEYGQQFFAMLLAVQMGRRGVYQAHKRDVGVDGVKPEGDVDENRDIGRTIRLTARQWSHPTERWRTTTEREPERDFHGMIPIPRSLTSVSSESERTADSDEEAGREAPCPVIRESQEIGRGARKPEGGLRRLFRKIATPFMTRRFRSTTADKASNR
ncbi:hypothetical protein GY45DRAFT_254728 [Cubamyces sp. BRFM 1775]|nr:hypothetical protein GY45DRAFT_254728 [Cubamyces sp. BRFM 1775]